MAAPQYDSHIIINGVPIAWVYPMFKHPSGDDAGLWDATGFTGADDAAKAPARFHFNNTQQPKFSIVRPASASATAQEFLQITRADAGIIEFPKRTPALVIDGTDGSAKSGGAGGTASGTTAKGSFLANEADMDSASYTAYLNKVKGYITSTALVCIPIGFNYQGTHNAAPTGAANAEGFFLCIGSVDTDIENAVNGYTPPTTTFSFTSKSLDADVVTELVTAQFPAIILPEGVSAGNIVGTSIQPPALTSDIWTALKKGEAVFL